MNNALQTLIAGAVAIGMATAVLLPGRQTPQVIKAASGLISGTLKTSITGK
ncbi:hypothetical protein [Actinomadura violacea]|uniref:Uncharacterized protein n=1 Tax=Actinomadura violacea TaxID=2819934 RepID=A0ABS3RY98_9ACTN|nr:hypothetical protein [Actinomadura violacea]MBO2460975.1 hypothetical protein [Actinomadura violacea]